MTNHALVTTGFPLKLSIKLWHQRLRHLEFENVKRFQDHSTEIHLDKTTTLQKYIWTKLTFLQYANFVLPENSTRPHLTSHHKGPRSAWS